MLTIVHIENQCVVALQARTVLFLEKWTVSGLATSWPLKWSFRLFDMVSS